MIQTCFFLASLFYSINSVSQIEKFFLKFVECEKQSEIRTISLHKIPKIKQKTQEFFYKVIYTKKGISHFIGKCKWPLSCQKILAKTQTNLEKNKWECKDIKGKIEITT